LILALLASATVATACPQFFAGGQPPSIAVDVQLCEDGYAVGYSVAQGDPLWSAQVETPESIAAAKKTARNGVFKACPGLPADEQISPSVYAHSGFDIGHMSESAASADKPATFILCNAAPQTPNLNRLAWAGLEQALRNLAGVGDTLYIVTGPCGGWTGQRLGGKVAVPIKTCKAVFDVTKQTAEAWSCTNTQTPMPVCAQETIEAAMVEMGGDPFPSVPAAIKATPWVMPPPTKGLQSLQ
jgi:endonuclease G